MSSCLTVLLSYYLTIFLYYCITVLLLYYYYCSIVLSYGVTCRSRHSLRCSHFATLSLEHSSSGVPSCLLFTTHALFALDLQTSVSSMYVEVAGGVTIAEGSTLHLVPLY